MAKVVSFSVDADLKGYVSEIINVAKKTQEARNEMLGLGKAMGGTAAEFDKTEKKAKDLGVSLEKLGTNAVKDLAGIAAGLVTVQALQQGANMLVQQYLQLQQQSAEAANKAAEGHAKALNFVTGTSAADVAARMAQVSANVRSVADVEQLPEQDVGGVMGGLEKSGQTLSRRQIDALLPLAAQATVRKTSMSPEGWGDLFARVKNTFPGLEPQQVSNLAGALQSTGADENMLNRSLAAASGSGDSPEQFLATVTAMSGKVQGRAGASMYAMAQANLQKYQSEGTGNPFGKASPQQEILRRYGVSQGDSLFVAMQKLHGASPAELAAVFEMTALESPGARKAMGEITPEAVAAARSNIFDGDFIGSITGGYNQADPRLAGLTQGKQGVASVENQQRGTQAQNQVVTDLWAAQSAKDQSRYFWQRYAANAGWAAGFFAGGSPALRNATADLAAGFGPLGFDPSTVHGLQKDVADVQANPESNRDWVKNLTDAMRVNTRATEENTRATRGNDVPADNRGGQP